MPILIGAAFGLASFSTLTDDPEIDDLSHASTSSELLTPCICAKCADTVTEQELLPCLCTGGLKPARQKRKSPLLDLPASNCGGGEFRNSVTLPLNEENRII